MLRTTFRTGTAVGILALTMVVAGATGAVAGKLITSSDIKDHTITSEDLAHNAVVKENLAPESVGWSSELTRSTRDRIRSLAGTDGAMGPVGPAGPEGPAGPRGATGPSGDDGSDGLDGEGRLVAWNYYGASDPVATEVPFVTQLPGLDGEEIVLTEPGVYLVTLQGVFTQAIDEGFDLDFPGLLLGEPDDPLNTLFNACTAEIFVFTCKSTFPLFVEADQVPLTLPLYVPGACLDVSCDTPAVAEASVFAMAGDVPDLSGLPELPPLGDCLCGVERSDRTWQKQAREFERRFAS